MLGTSPFIGAGQFGRRSLDYLSRFYNKPDRIVEIIDACWETGVNAIQLLPEKYIIDAISMWEKKNGEIITVISSIFRLRQIDDLINRFEHSAMLVHASIVDYHDKDILNRFLSKIRERGLPAGIVSHTPYRTLSWIKNWEIDIDIAMIPINKIGYMMDADIERIGRLIRKIDCKVIAKKFLLLAEYHQKRH